MPYLTTILQTMSIICLLSYRNSHKNLQVSIFLRTFAFAKSKRLEAQKHLNVSCKATSIKAKMITFTITDNAI